jgi:hypothetical protein
MRGVALPTLNDPRGAARRGAARRGGRPAPRVRLRSPRVGGARRAILSQAQRQGSRSKLAWGRAGVGPSRSGARKGSVPDEETGIQARAKGTPLMMRGAHSAGCVASAPQRCGALGFGRAARPAPRRRRRAGAAGATRPRGRRRSLGRICESGPRGQAAPQDVRAGRLVEGEGVASAPHLPAVGAGGGGRERAGRRPVGPRSRRERLACARGQGMDGLARGKPSGRASAMQRSAAAA